MIYKCLFLFIPLLITAGLCSEQKCSFEILEISELPNPDQIPYPDGAAVCLCKTSDDEKILVVIHAIAKREVLPAFLKYKTGTQLSGTLALWSKRPAKWRAMAVANDYTHEYDLKLYYFEPASSSP